MKNCLILGTGRSGTSMLGGILHEAGYFMGDGLYGPGQASNPKGFFESPDVNGLNEELLKPYDKHSAAYLGHSLSRLFLGPFQKKRRVLPKTWWRWLALIPAGVEVQCHNAALLQRIAGLTSRTPFGYKDPRFSFTLPVWEPQLPEDTRFLCVFRDPGVTASSVVKECRDRPYLQSLCIDEPRFYELYELLYARVLERAQRSPDRFMFLHYEQIYTGSALPRLSRFLEATLTSQFVEPALKRSARHERVPPFAAQIYDRLCEKAEFEREKQACQSRT